MALYIVLVDHDNNLGSHLNHARVGERIDFYGN